MKVRMKKHLNSMMALFLAVFVAGLTMANDPMHNTMPSLADLKYRKCNSSQDCTVLAQPCRAPVAINKNSQAELNAWVNDPGYHFSCSVAKTNLLNVPVCVSGTCALQTMSGG